MRCFHQAIGVPVNTATLTKAKNFSIQVTPTVGTPGQGYTDANQPNLNKIQQDHCIGKVGEEAVKTVFQQLGKQVQGPDYRIYSSHQKSWDADLYIDRIGLSVKTQTTIAAAKFGLSWTFQAGASRQDPILHEPEAWVCFVEFNELKQHCIVYPPYQVKELEFREPKLTKLRGKKKVVYAESLCFRFYTQ